MSSWCSLQPMCDPSQVKQLFGPAWNAVASRYRAAVFKELSGYGLRYDDLYDPLKNEVGAPWRPTRPANIMQPPQPDLALTSCRTSPRLCAACPPMSSLLATAGCAALRTWT
jgi:hypothetical protein